MNPTFRSVNGPALPNIPKMTKAEGEEEVREVLWEDGGGLHV